VFTQTALGEGKGHTGFWFLKKKMRGWRIKWVIILDLVYLPLESHLQRDGPAI
jgi:hypothetical protein